MYSMYANGVCFYNDAFALEEMAVLEPKLTLEDCSAGSLSFKLPQSNPAHETIARLVTDISVQKDGKEIWAGRVLSDEKDFWNNRSIYCEGELAFFNDSSQLQKQYHCTIRGFLESIIDVHNQQVKPNRRFQVGAVTVEEDEAVDFVTDYQKTMEVVNALIETYGGHMRIRKDGNVRYLDYLNDDSLEGIDQLIQFGENLLDFTRSWDSTEYATAILPLGAKKTGSASDSDDDTDKEESAYYLTVESVNGGKLYVENAAAVAKYGWIERVIRYEDETDPASLLSKARSYLAQFQNGEVTVVLPYGAFLGGIEEDEAEPDTSVEGLESYVTVESVNKGSIFVSSSELVDKYGWIVQIVNFDDIDDPAKLLEQAQKYLAELQYDTTQIELSALDLHYINPEIKDVRLLDKVRVLSRPHNLDSWFAVTKLEIPLDSPENSQFTLGDIIKTSLTQVNNQVNTDLIAKINTMPKAHDILDKAKKNATQIIRATTTGHITITQNKQGADTLYISEGMDYTKSKRLWIWNMGGLAYSKDGGETVEVAMTMDGSITANFITVGTMAADRIRTGLLQSENDNFSLNLNDGTLTMKKGSIDIGGKFTVTDEGILTANEATIVGTIRASAGNIGGLTIDPDGKLYSNSGNWYVGVNGSNTNDDREYAFWTGNPKPEKSPFWVKKNGEMYASKGTFSGKLEAATGSFTGVVQASDFLDQNGNSMFTSQNKFKADYLDLYGLTVWNKSTGIESFKVDKNGKVTINGSITMGAGSVIDWAQIGNENITSNPAYSLATKANNNANQAISDADIAQSRADQAYALANAIKIPSYITSTKITQTTIESPTIRGGTFIGESFNVIAGGKYGSFNLYGSYGSSSYHMLAIDYFEGDSPEVHYHSPASADLYFGSEGYCFIYFDGDVSFRGSVDFSRANVTGLK